MPLRRLLLVFALLAFLPGKANSQDCLAGTVVAEETSPGSGAWRYRTTLTYDLSPLDVNPSHFNLILGALTTCGCACSAGLFGFESPAGASPGTDQVTGLPGTVEYQGSMDCGGDPTLSHLPGPSIKWEAPASSTIEPDPAGVGTFTFLSLLPPGPSSSTTAVIKFARQACSGTVTGTLPGCDCPTPVQPGSWGRLKLLYR